MTGQPANARETYEAYLRGEVTTEQIDQRAKEWYEASLKNAPATKSGINPATEADT